MTLFWLRVNLEKMVTWNGICFTQVIRQLMMVGNWDLGFMGYICLERNLPT